MSCLRFFLQLLPLILLFALLSLASTFDTSELFENWCKEHGKAYSSEEEKRYRSKVFEDNYDFVARHNQRGRNSSYTLSLNAFADLTHHEFKASRLGLPPHSSFLRFNRFQDQQPNDRHLEVPSEIDWRNTGAVTPVKDQGSCGTYLPSTIYPHTVFFKVILLPKYRLISLS